MILLKDTKSKLYYYNYKDKLKQLDFNCESKNLCVIGNNLIILDRKVNVLEVHNYNEDFGYSPYDISNDLSTNIQGNLKLIPSSYYLNFVPLLICSSGNINRWIDNSNSSNNINKSITSNILDHTNKSNTSKILEESFMKDTCSSPMSNFNFVRPYEKSRIHNYSCNGSFSGLNNVSITNQRGLSSSSTFPKNEINMRNRNSNAISPNHYKIHTMYSLLDRMNRSVDLKKSSQLDKLKQIENLLQVSEVKKSFNISTIKADRSHYVANSPPKSINKDVNNFNNASLKKVIRDSSSSMLSQTSVTSDSNRKNKNFSTSKNIVIKNESFLLSTPTKNKTIKEDSFIKEELPENKSKPYQKKILAKSSLSVSKYRLSKPVKLISEKIKTIDKKMDFLSCDKNKADLIINNTTESEEKRNKFEPLELDTQSILSMNSKIQSTIRSEVNPNLDETNSCNLVLNNQINELNESHFEVKLKTEDKTNSLNSSIIKSQKLNAVDIYTIKAREIYSGKNRTRNASILRKKDLNLAQVKSKNLKI